jgi:hypothetical protein
MIGVLRRGPPLSRVETVSEMAIDRDPKITEFSILP